MRVKLASLVHMLKNLPNLKHLELNFLKLDYIDHWRDVLDLLHAKKLQPFWLFGLPRAVAKYVGVKCRDRSFIARIHERYLACERFVLRWDPDLSNPLHEFEGATENVDDLESFYV